MPLVFGHTVKAKHDDDEPELNVYAFPESGKVSLGICYLSEESDGGSASALMPAKVARKLGVALIEAAALVEAGE